MYEKTIAKELVYHIQYLVKKHSCIRGIPAGICDNNKTLEVKTLSSML